LVERGFPACRRSRPCLAVAIRAGALIDHLALEELAKPPLLWGLDPTDDAKKWKSFWAERFSRHLTKQNTIGAYGSLTGIGQDIYWFKLHPDIVKTLDTWKQWGFYVDCVDNKFQSPDLFASEQREIVDLLFAIAEERADSFAQFHSSAESSLAAYEQRLTARGESRE
jgi:AbiV family abortive infection protein